MNLSRRLGILFTIIVCHCLYSFSQNYNSEIDSASVKLYYYPGDAFYCNDRALWIYKDYAVLMTSYYDFDKINKKSINISPKTLYKITHDKGEFYKINASNENRHLNFKGKKIKRDINESSDTMFISLNFPNFNDSLFVSVSVSSFNDRKSYNAECNSFMNSTVFKIPRIVNKGTIYITIRPANYHDYLTFDTNDPLGPTLESYAQISDHIDFDLSVDGNVFSITYPGFDNTETFRCVTANNNFIKITDDTVEWNGYIFKTEKENSVVFDNLYQDFIRTLREFIKADSEEEAYNKANRVYITGPLPH